MSATWSANRKHSPEELVRNLTPLKRFEVDDAIRTTQKIGLRSERRISADAVCHIANVIGDTDLSE
jgi:hypothetical protein